jgi:hypothetical protein
MRANCSCVGANGPVRTGAATGVSTTGADDVGSGAAVVIGAACDAGVASLEGTIVGVGASDADAAVDATSFVSFAAAAAGVVCFDLLLPHLE